MVTLLEDRINLEIRTNKLELIPALKSKSLEVLDLIQKVLDSQEMRRVCSQLVEVALNLINNRDFLNFEIKQQLANCFVFDPAIIPRLKPWLASLNSEERARIPEKLREV